MNVSPASIEALQDAMCKRGPRKGLLLASAPKSDTLAFAAWQAAVLEVNPFKASVGAVLFMTDEQMLVYRDVQTMWAALSPQKQAVLRYGLDKDARALHDLGVF